MLIIQSFISLLIPARGLIINNSSLSTEFPSLFGSVYASSKAALNAYSSALRMELRPFNVRVMVSLTGFIRSNFSSKVEQSLPPNSLYSAVNDMYQSRITWSQRANAMSPEDFAKGLVTDALKGEGLLGGWIGGTPDWYWGGGMAGFIWWLTLFPRWFSEGVIASYSGMGKISSRIREARQKQD
jgi:1-acylglycerone phosphate reductase